MESRDSAVRVFRAHPVSVTHWLCDTSQATQNSHSHLETTVNNGLFWHLSELIYGTC